MIDGRWIILMFFSAMAVTVALVALAVKRNRTTVERKKAALRASFDALVFITPEGTVHGDALEVVKIAYQPGQEAPNFASSGGPGHWDAFWYATGPGPSYFVVVCMVDTNDPATPPRWVIRPIDEARMRAALVDDPHAQALAFGGAIKA